MLLSHQQRIGAAVLFSIAMIAWIAYAVWPSRQTLPPPSEPAAKTPKRSWEQIKDSMRLADSLRYAQWAVEREQRYDSFRIADSLRRAERRAELLRYRDSAHIADSLWRDSLGIRYPRHEKRDTIIDLNHCDTSDLLYVRGIGRFTAVQIIRYRQQLGGYYSPYQLTDEPFAKCHLDTLLSHFIADTAAIQTIPVNTASIERMQSHPYLRFSQAKAIYTLRRNKIKLRSIDDLRSLPELSEQDLQRLAPYLQFE